MMYRLVNISTDPTEDQIKMLIRYFVTSEGVDKYSRNMLAYLKENTPMTGSQKFTIFDALEAFRNKWYVDRTAKNKILSKDTISLWATRFVDIKQRICIDVCPSNEKFLRWTANVFTESVDRLDDEPVDSVLAYYAEKGNFTWSQNEIHFLLKYVINNMHPIYVDGFISGCLLSETFHWDKEDGIKSLRTISSDLHDMILDSPHSNTVFEMLSSVY